MKYDTIAQILTEIRLNLQLKIINNNLTKVSYTPELDFLKQILLLIPSDLLFSPNLNYSPFLTFRLWWNNLTPKEYLLQRCSDINLMTSRILFWYETHLPFKNENNESDIICLLEFKIFIENLQIKNNEYKNLIETSYRHTQSTLCCCLNNLYCTIGSCWDDTWELCFYSYYYGCLLYFPNSQPVDSKYEIRERYAGEFGSGGARKYYCSSSPSSSSSSSSPSSTSRNGCCHCNDLQCYYCYDGCCRCFCDCLWYSTTPQPTYTYSTTYHHGSSYQQNNYYYYGHQSNNNICCRECCVSTGLLDNCKDCWRGIGSCCKNGGECVFRGCGHCIHGISSNGCSKCDCPKCDGCNCDGGHCNGCGNVGDDCVKGIMTVCGAIAGIVSATFDAITSSGKNNDDDNYVVPINGTNSTVRYLSELTYDRRLEDQTTAEYTPSIILMVISILIFAPRVFPNTFYALLNIYQGIARNRALKSLTAMIVFGLTIGLVVSSFGGASGWTFVTITLLTMHLSYSWMTISIKKVDPDILDISFLSCKEWRQFNLQEGGSYLHGLLGTLISYKERIRHEMKKLAHYSTFLVPFLLLWPAVFKAYIRWNLSTEIIDAHQLNISYLQNNAKTHSWELENIPELRAQQESLNQIPNQTIPIAIATPIPGTVTTNLIQKDDRI